MLKTTFKKLCKKLLKLAKIYYKDRLITLSIFGSVGRETMNPESDIDLLIVARKLPMGRINRVREFYCIEKKLEKELKILTKKGIHTSISPIFKTPEEVKMGSPIFLDMIYDSKILYDEKNFFKNFIKEFKKRLKKLKSKRIIQGEKWYWILKPDCKPGEVFEI